MVLLCPFGSVCLEWYYYVHSFQFVKGLILLCPFERTVCLGERYYYVRSFQFELGTVLLCPFDSLSRGHIIMSVRFSLNRMV